MKKAHETRITIRFPSKLVEEVKELAEQESRSINSKVVYAAREYVAKKRKERAQHEHEDL